jgi:2-polyprenyl-3-methyl-5-hydroxy-6-metoxy-1,4-benzoquinol methylase
MLARRHLPDAWVEFNERWGIPNGRREFLGRSARARRLYARFPRLRGPFQYQRNNDTRICEYAWAFERIMAAKPRRVLDVGGGLCGLQFVLERSGVHVVTVDPGEESTGLGWPVDAESMGRLNKAFGTNVELISTTVQAAGLSPGSIDVAYAISTLEHIPPGEISSLMTSIESALKPDGLVVLTIDLFLELHPFTTAMSNRWGTNIDIAELITASGLRMVDGYRDELYGFNEFSTDVILSRLEDFYVGYYHPCLAQCLVLKKLG